MPEYSFFSQYQIPFLRQRSGQLPLTTEMRVVEAIATMGGFTTWARKNQVKIFRRTPGGLVEFHFNFSAYAAGKDESANILLQPGDTIVVPD
jgi:polysaccharide export outer membrane protein